MTESMKIGQFWPMTGCFSVLFFDKKKMLIPEQLRGRYEFEVIRSKNFRQIVLHRIGTRKVKKFMMIAILGLILSILTFAKKLNSNFKHLFHVIFSIT